MRALVVGATGILAPATQSLLGRGDDVVAVARSAQSLAALTDRHRDSPGRLATLAADARRPDFVDRVVAELGGSESALLDAALVYAPAATDAVVDALGMRCRGPLVQILTSAQAAPTDGGDSEVWTISMLPSAAHIRLVLGWTVTHTGTRWHTPEEVSAAAINALDTQRDSVLGALRPWSARP